MINKTGEGSNYITFQEIQVKEESPLPDLQLSEEALTKVPFSLFKSFEVDLPNEEVAFLFLNAYKSCLHDPQSGVHYAERGILALKHQIHLIKSTVLIEALYAKIVSLLKQNHFLTKIQVEKECSTYYIREFKEECSQTIKEQIWQRLGNDLWNILLKKKYTTYKIQDNRDSLYILHGFFLYLKIISLYQRGYFDKVIKVASVLLNGSFLMDQEWPQMWTRMVLTNCFLRLTPPAVEEAVNMLISIKRCYSESYPEIDEECLKCINIIEKWKTD